MHDRQKYLLGQRRTILDHQTGQQENENYLNHLLYLQPYVERVSRERLQNPDG